MKYVAIVEHCLAEAVFIFRYNSFQVSCGKFVFYCWEFFTWKEECRGEEAERSLYENLWQKVICGMGKIAK